MCRTIVYDKAAEKIVVEMLQQQQSTIAKSKRKTEGKLYFAAIVLSEALDARYLWSDELQYKID